MCLLKRQDHKDNSGGHTRPFKRPRMVGIGIYQAEDGFTTLNPGMPSRRVIRTGAKVTKRYDVVIGNTGYTPRKGFKWKRKSAITNSKLEKMRAEKVIQTRESGSDFGGGQDAKNEVEIVWTCDEKGHEYPNSKVGETVFTCTLCNKCFPAMEKLRLDWKRCNRARQAAQAQAQAQAAAVQGGDRG
ncbi:hypothetical protein FXO38_01902 [Capsicum annuum]|nr:hypothetical protein FXO38_01902 [Capsicum annuum]